MAKPPMIEPPVPASEFHHTPGAAPFGDAGWRGINTEAGPGRIAPNELLWGQDIRRRGKILETRPGYTLLVDLTALAQAGEYINTLKESPTDNPRTRLWASCEGCLGATGTFTSTTGARFYHFDVTESPALQLYSDIYAESDKIVPLAKFGDSLMVGDGSVLREAVIITPPFGVDPTTIIGDPPQVTIKKFDGYIIRSMIEYGGELYISLEDTTTIGASKIVVWDGLEFEDDLTGIRPALAFGLYQDKLIAGFDSTAGHIRVRSFGSTHPGTWTTIALAGFRCSEFQNAIQECRDKVYIAGGADNLYVYDGSTLAVARNIVGADTGVDGVTALCVHDGLLHYAWNTITTFRGKLGRHDPDSTAANEYVDTYKDVYADQNNFKYAAAMCSYRGRIWIGGWRNWIVASAINDVQGTVEVIKDGGTGSTGFAVQQLMVFP